MSDEVKTKVCSKCKVVKVVAEFSKDKNRKDGFKYECKRCCAERSRKYHRENIDKMTGKGRKYRKENPEKESERHRKYRKENQEKINMVYRKYYQKHNEKMIERSRKDKQTAAEYNLFLKHLEQEEKEQQQ
jgi:hypothetical protein